MCDSRRPVLADIIKMCTFARRLLSGEHLEPPERRVNSRAFGRARRLVNRPFKENRKRFLVVILKLKMNTLSYKTISANKETVNKEWVVIDASGQVVGRLCSKVAKLLRGKYKPNFTPHVDCGDNVILINAAKVVFSGKKETDKVYTRYTGYPGGQRFNTPAELRKRPFGADRIIRHAVKGMLPKGPLGRSLMDNLYIFDGTEHNMQAQKPKAIDINQYK